ncbi:MAG: beta-ketoacyl synthase [Deltaproteobacteria bacterium]|nr:beta-ketoacyl synthase [Deltaproteobacteria bacterium]
MTAAVIGMGWITAAGMGPGGDRKGFAVTAGELPRLARKRVLDTPCPHFGRMDDLSRLGLAAIGFALKDAHLAEWTQPRDIGIIAVSVCGCLRTDMDYFETVMPDGGRMASPALFSYTLPNAFLGEAAICFGLTGTGYVINDASPSGLACLHAALEGIAGGEVEKMVCGFCDPGCPPEFFLPVKGPAGALFFVLEKVPEDGRSSYGTLRLDRRGRVFFNGEEIETLVQLGHACSTPSH